MRKKFRWIYVYVGYYEVVITDKKLAKPLSYASKHKDVFNAEKFINKAYPSADILYDKDIQDLTDWGWMSEEDDDYSRIFYDFADCVAA